MYQAYLDSYNQGIQEGNEAYWNDILAASNKDDIWLAIYAKLWEMKAANRYDVLTSDYENIDELIAAVRNYVDSDERYNELYGKNNSDARHKDLIELAKLIALYQHEPNYHRFLLCDGLVEEDMNSEKIYLKPHAELCVVKNQNGRKFDLLLFEDLLNDLNMTCRLRNFYNQEAINPAQTIDHSDCRFRQRYRTLSRQISGSLSKPTFHALRAFVEVVANEFDANHSLDCFIYRFRVATKYEAFVDLCAFLESLPPAERNLLYNTRINGDGTFKDRMESVKRGACASLFADDLTKILYQCDPAIQFTNPRARQIIERVGNQLVVRGTVIDTSDADQVYLANLQKVILNTTFTVRIGTKVSVEGDAKSNRVPSHVAEMFDFCAKGLAGQMDPGEAKYRAIAIAAQCYRRPHNSFFFFLNTRDVTSHNFYGMAITDKFESIINENDALHDHQDFLGIAPPMA